MTTFYYFLKNVVYALCKVSETDILIYWWRLRQSRWHLMKRIGLDPKSLWTSESIFLPLCVWWHTYVTNCFNTVNLLVLDLEAQVEEVTLVKVLVNPSVPTTESWQEHFTAPCPSLQMLKIVQLAGTCPYFGNIKLQEWQEIMFINEAWIQEKQATQNKWASSSNIWLDFYFLQLSKSLKPKVIEYF